MQCVPQWPAHRYHPSLPPSPSASLCQLVPPVPSPLIHKLLYAAAALLIAAENAAAAESALPPSPRLRECPGYRVPGTLYATAAAPVAAITPRPSSHQPLPSAAYQVRAPLSTTIGRVPPPLEGALFLFILTPSWYRLIRVYKQLIQGIAMTIKSICVKTELVKSPA
jgi:hypothetical protein